MKIRGKKILVTGGAGFIGSHLCERLLKEGSEVIVLDNFCTGKMSNIEKIKKFVSLIRGDITNKKLIDRCTTNVDIIVHEAFPYGISGMDMEKLYAKEGVIGTVNLLKSAVKNNVKKVVFASSVAVYGLQKYFPIDENHPADPFLPYGATKRAGELYCSAFSKIYNLETISLRYFYVYGPRYSALDHSALVNFIDRALGGMPLIIYGDGRQIRDYTYIDDAIEGTIKAIKKDHNYGDIYNISSGKSISILELAKKVKRIVGGETDIKFAENQEYKYIRKCKIPVGMTTRTGSGWTDERNYSADLTYARKRLNYLPKVGLEEGIAKTIKWLKVKKYDKS